MQILILPGLYNSGPGHWQTLWEAELPDVKRVEQQDWDHPVKDAWVATLSAAVDAVDDDVVLVAHSMGCALTAWWLASGMPGLLHKSKVRAAFLVAPPDVGRADFPAPSFSPMPLIPFPFPVAVVASSDDPWCDLSVAQDWAKAWGAEMHIIGAAGHINGESDLGSWKQGQDWLNALVAKTEKTKQ
ncbi:RBBP9/YdeN family alpha/beta hydrolase [Undibacterium hunanense]|uniref:RBBP9/YdeN family alpha/beta hydrolase n=1 Tax=Undibacterium hunanense TaxID=2762292 RepID=UPI002E31BB06|nr:alpha/beta hydrolase [Undibacterium hunanense]